MSLPTTTWIAALALATVASSQAIAGVEINSTDWNTRLQKMVNDRFTKNSDGTEKTPPKGCVVKFDMPNPYMYGGIPSKVITECKASTAENTEREKYCKAFDEYLKKEPFEVKTGTEANWFGRNKDGKGEFVGQVAIPRLQCDKSVENRRKEIEDWLAQSCPQSPKKTEGRLHWFKTGKNYTDCITPKDIKETDYEAASEVQLKALLGNVEGPQPPQPPPPVPDKHVCAGAGAESVTAETDAAYKIISKPVSIPGYEGLDGCKHNPICVYAAAIKCNKKEGEAEGELVHKVIYCNVGNAAGATCASWGTDANLKACFEQEDLMPLESAYPPGSTPPAATPEDIQTAIPAH